MLTIDNLKISVSDMDKVLTERRRSRLTGGRKFEDKYKLTAVAVGGVKFIGVPSGCAFAKFTQKVRNSAETAAGMIGVPAKFVVRGMAAGETAGGFTAPTNGVVVIRVA